MRANFTQLYIHCVWATWNRHPLITPNIRNSVYGSITHSAQDLGCTVIAIGGIADHIHLLTSLPTTLTVARLIKNVKGTSSHLINQEVNPNQFFKWQGSYAAFSVSRRGLDPVSHYIQNQENHHRQKSPTSDWELPF
ncbi:MAG: IS200/IS605 family transposase [Cyanobacteria bacterium P01_F01_bin.4]